MGSSVWKGRISYASIYFGFVLLSATVSTLLMYYYTDVLLLPAIAVSAILFLIRLFDGIVDPFLGYWMDKRSTKRGKYRGYVLYWVAPMCLSFVLMFLAVPFSGAGRIVWSFLTYLAFALSLSFLEISSLPMLSSFGSGANRSANNTMKIIAGVFATLIATFFALNIVQTLGRGSEQSGYGMMAALFAGVSLIAVLWGALNVREGAYATDALTPAKKGKAESWRKTLGIVFRQRNILFLLLMCVCLDAATAFKMQAGIYFLKYNMGRQDLTTLFLSISIVVSLFTQPFVHLCAKRFRHRTLIVGGCVASAAAFLLIGLSGSSIALFLAGNCVYGMASAFPANLSFAYMAELSEKLSIRQGRPMGGVVHSFIGLAARVGSSAASALIPVILTATLYVPNAAQNAQTLAGISVSFIGLPVLAMGLAALFGILSFHTFRGKGETQEGAPERVAADVEVELN